MSIKIYRDPDDNSVTIMGCLDVDADTSEEKIREILSEYAQKIGISNPDVRVWSPDDLYKE